MCKSAILFVAVLLMGAATCCPTTDVDDAPQLPPSQQTTYTVQLIPVAAETRISSCATEKLQNEIDNLHLKTVTIETKCTAIADEQKIKIVELEKKVPKCDTIDSRIAAVESKTKRCDELESKILEMEKKLGGIDALKTQMAALESQITNLETELASQKSVSAVTATSLTIGRWVIQSEGDTLVFRDTKFGGDKRYAFAAGGHSDMYTAGTGGTINANRIVFPIRWSIGEESGSYLVFRDRGVAGRDHRYAMSANSYKDV